MVLTFQDVSVSKLTQLRRMGSEQFADTETRALVDLSERLSGSWELSRGVDCNGNDYIVVSSSADTRDLTFLFYRCLASVGLICLVMDEQMSVGFYPSMRWALRAAETFAELESQHFDRQPLSPLNYARKRLEPLEYATANIGQS